MTTANWLTILGTLVAIASTWGGLLVRVRVAESAIRDFNRAREKQGERIGALEARLSNLEGVTLEDARPRRRTRPIPVTPDPDEESGDVRR